MLIGMGCWAGSDPSLAAGRAEVVGGVLADGARTVVVRLHPAHRIAVLARHLKAPTVDPQQKPESGTHNVVALKRIVGLEVRSFGRRLPTNQIGNEPAVLDVD